MTTTHEPQQFVAFTFGAEEYALPIAQVQEIIRYTEPRSVAASDAGVRGVIALRGTIVPVHDVGRRLGLPVEIEAPTKIVMVEAGDGPVGIVVDDVTEVLTVDDAAIDRPRAASPAVAGVARVGQRLVVLLDAVALLQGTSAVVLDEAAADAPVVPVGDAADAVPAA